MNRNRIVFNKAGYKINTIYIKNIMTKPYKPYYIHNGNINIHDNKNNSAIIIIIGPPIY